MPALPSTPFTSIDSARVAVDAPISTDLMTDFGVNFNYLKSAVDILGGFVVVPFYATDTWTCPAGVTKIRVREKGQGGGGGGGGDNSFAGNDGADGDDTYFDDAANAARGGKGGGGGVITGGVGAQAANIAPVIDADFIQYGSFTTLDYPAAMAGTATNELKEFSLLASANGGTSSGSPTAGSNGVANTGQGGGGGGTSAGALKGGANGGPGEIAEYWLTVVPGTVYDVVVGVGGGAGGAAGGGGSRAGGNGAEGYLIIEY